MFTAPLHNNGSYSIVACIFFAAGVCLPNLCLAMDVYSDFAIPAFGRHVTIHRPALIVSTNHVFHSESLGSYSKIVTLICANKTVIRTGITLQRFRKKYSNFAKHKKLYHKVEMKTMMIWKEKSFCIADISFERNDRRNIWPTSSS
jgi:hypothetical protein